MRTLVTSLFLVGMLVLVAPAQAQLRDAAATERSPIRLYDTGAPAFTLNRLFSPEHFQMSHSFEMSMGSYGGASSSLGMYTNTLRWQFNQQLAARVDVAFAYSPFDGQSELGAFGQQNNGRVFLRNAEVAYRPSEKVQIHFQMRQSPYGRYAGPFGYYRPGHDAFGFSSADALFWNDHVR